MDPNLAKAIVDFQNGDVSAFETIYELQYNHVYYIAYQYAKNKEAAEDVAQDVFIEIYRSLGGLDTVTHFNAWLNRVVYHAFLRTIRNKQDTMRVDIGEDTLETFVPDEKQILPDEDYHHQEAIKAVEIVFNKLSEDLQKVARMRFYDELSLQEISEILDIPVGT